MSVDIRIEFKDGTKATYEDGKWHSKSSSIQSDLRKFSNHTDWHENDDDSTYSPDIISDYADYVVNIVRAEVKFVKANQKLRADVEY